MASFFFFCKFQLDKGLLSSLCQGADFLLWLKVPTHLPVSDLTQASPKETKG